MVANIKGYHVAAGKLINKKPRGELNRHGAFA